MVASRRLLLVSLAMLAGVAAAYEAPKPAPAPPASGGGAAYRPPATGNRGGGAGGNGAIPVPPTPLQPGGAYSPPGTNIGQPLQPGGGAGIKPAPAPGPQPLPAPLPAPAPSDGNAPVDCARCTTCIAYMGGDGCIKDGRCPPSCAKAGNACTNCLFRPGITSVQMALCGGMQANPQCFAMRNGGKGGVPSDMPKPPVESSDPCFSCTQCVAYGGGDTCKGRRCPETCARSNACGMCLFNRFFFAEDKTKCATELPQCASLRVPLMKRPDGPDSIEDANNAKKLLGGYNPAPGTGTPMKPTPPVAPPVAPSPPAYKKEEPKKVPAPPAPPKKDAAYKEPKKEPPAGNPKGVDCDISAFGAPYNCGKAYKNGRAIGDKQCVKVNDKHVTLETICPYVKLRDAAKKGGASLTVVSGFRTMDRQTELYNGWVARKPGYNLAARPGYSNHQHGIAFDLNAHQTSSAQYRWLKQNGQQFGFIRTVPSEPWHWEYSPGERCSIDCAR